MKLKTTRFGEIEVVETQIYTFRDGLPGFPDVKRFAILANPQGGAFQWMQAADLAALAFVITDPVLFFPGYKITARAEELVSVELADVSGGIVLVILTVPKNPVEITANLLGPLLFNAKAKLARQVVQTDPQYSTKHRLFKDVT